MAKTAIVVGAGIVGLATARALAIRGYKVRVIERNLKAIGASVRNFGMIWPIGQPSGVLYERAMLSRNIWKQVCNEAGIWYEEKGSLHIANREDEWQVLQEFAEAEHKQRGCLALSGKETRSYSEAVAVKGIAGSLWSGNEMIVDPRQAIAFLPLWLSEKYDVEFCWGRVVNGIHPCVVYTGDGSIEADEIYVCCGSDFETLYPELYAAASITKCKLQMMRMAAQPDAWRIGPSLCGSLSLIHYKSFAMSPSLPALQERFAQEYADYLKWGIHVMVSQNQAGELTIGDSHEYGLTPDPFDRLFINDMILAYLQQFAQVRHPLVTESWNGVYPKMMNGDTEIVLHPADGVTIINGLGGAGMTLSFGLCEQVVAGLYPSKQSC